MPDPLTVPAPSPVISPSAGEPVVAPVVRPPEQVTQSPVIRNDAANTNVSAAQQQIRSVAEAIHQLRRAKAQGTVPSAVAGPDILRRPGFSTLDNVREWARQSGMHAASVLGEEAAFITEAQVRMADANTRKYRLDEPIGLFESAGMGYDQAELFRMTMNKANGGVFTPEQEQQYKEQKFAYKNSHLRKNTSPFIGSLFNSVGNMFNTAVSRAVPLAVTGAVATGAVGATIGGVMAGPAGAAIGGDIFAKGGFLAGLATGFTADTIIQGHGQTMLALEDVTGIDDSTKNAISWVTGSLHGLLENATGTGALARTGFQSTGLTKWVTKELVNNPNLVARLGTKLTDGAVHEGITEFEQEGVSILAEVVATKLGSKGLDQSNLDPEDRRYLFTLDNLLRAGEAGAGGFVAGAGFATPHALATMHHRERADGEDATGKANQMLAAIDSMSKTELSKTAPDVARDMMHTVGLHQKIYLDPEALSVVSGKVLNDMGIKPEEVLAAGSLGQYFETSTINLLSAKNKDDLYTILPFIKTTALGDTADVSKLNHKDTYAQQLESIKNGNNLVNTQGTEDSRANDAKFANQLAGVENSNAKVGPNNIPSVPGSVEAKLDARKQREFELQGALHEALNKQAREKLVLDHAVKTKKQELNEIISNNPALAHEIIQRGGVDTKDYVSSVVKLYTNYATYLADGDMTAADWINSLKVEHLGKFSNVVNSRGKYNAGRIELNNASNGTTLVHEGTHHFLDIWLNSHDSLKDSHKAELQELIAWSGAGTLDEVRTNETSYRNFHEAVAVAAEELLTKGTVFGKISASVQKMLDRLVGMFRKVYEGDRISKAEGRVGLTPEVSAILGRWMQGSDQASVAAAGANLLDEQVSAAIKNMPLDEQEKALLRTSLARLLENSKRRMNRENAREIIQKRAEIVSQETSTANESLGRIAITVGQHNQLSAFEVRTILGEAELQDLINKDMISNAFDVKELVHGSGYTMEEFADNLLNPGGTYAIEAMETIRFLKETNGLHDDWLNANFSAAEAKIISTFVKIVPAQKITIPRRPYTYDAEVYTALMGGNPSTYARSLLTRQYQSRFTKLTTLMLPLVNGKLRKEIESKLRSVKRFGNASEDRLNNFDIGAKAKIFSQKDVDFLQRLGNVEELKSLKHEILDEAIALNHAISGISTSIVEKADIKELLRGVIEMDSRMRSVYRVGDWWDQQFLSRWLTGNVTANNEKTASEPVMPQLWQSYFSLLSDIKSGKTEGLHSAWLKELVSPQIRAQLTEITAPNEATGLTSFGIQRPPEAFDKLSGAPQKVELALTSEETNAEARKQIISIAMIPREVRRILGEIHDQGGVNEADVPESVRQLFIDNGLIKNTEPVTLADYFSKVKEAVNEVQGPYTTPENLEEAILHVLDTPDKLQDQIAKNVNEKMTEFMAQESPERLLREQSGWQYMQDMANALTSILNKKGLGGEKTHPEVYIHQAANEIAGKPVKNATDANKAYADFARMQRDSLRELIKGNFLEALVLHEKAMRNYQLSIQASALKASVEAQLRRAKTLARVREGSLDNKYHAAYLAMAFKMGMIGRMPKWAAAAEPGAVLEAADRGEANRILQMARPENANYSKMTAGNFVVLNEALQMLDRLAFVKSDAAAFELRSRPGQRISANKLSASVVADLKDYTPTQGNISRISVWVGDAIGISRFIKGLNSQVTRFDELFQQLNKFRNVNGKGTNGPLDVVYNEFLEGDRVKNKIQDKGLGVFHKHLSAFLKVDMPKVNRELPTGKYAIEWTPERVFMFCSYFGNEYQSNALMEGYGLTREESQQILDAMPEQGWKHINACVAEASANQAQLSKAHVEVHGFQIKMESALPFKAGGETRPGGYLYMYYDYSLIPKDVAGHYKDLSLDSTSAIIPPNASTGREVARRASGGRPPSLSTDVFGRGMRDQAHYIGFAQPVALYNATMGANKSELRKEARRILGEEAFKLLDEHVERLDPSKSHNFIADGALEKFVVKTKAFATLSALALNIQSGIKSHIAQYPVGMNAIGMSMYAKGIVKFLTDKDFRNFITENSPHIKEAFGALELAAKSATTNLDSYGKLSTFKKGTQTAVMYQHMIADMPHRFATWAGAWEHFSDLPHQERILEADKLVSQLMPMGATLEKTRLSYNEKSNWYIASAFSTVLSATKGRRNAYFGGWQNGTVSNFEFAKFMVVEHAMSPLVWSMSMPLLAYALTQDDEWLDSITATKIVTDLAGYQLAALPVARELSAVLASKFNGQPARFGVLPLSFIGQLLSNGYNALGGGEYTPEERAMLAAATIAPMVGIPVSTLYNRIYNNMTKHDQTMFDAILLGKP